ncbi:glycosyltransferase [Asticcacaulis sp. 201]|uniref:glycosyltransferase n=1 Tax=Asticcacaulis sp. 201 TaxID=3028787 RepID=UPI0029160DC5|nr:glycosyltransferase [Asticcacaulis sp. 201]MDV6330745.1 glycosyltransferase [Asticcacaulis sp. 201]
MLAKARGGVESMAAYYHEALSAEGVEVLSLGHPRGVLAREVPAKGFAPLAARIDFDPIAAIQLQMYCRRFRPDLILAHGNRAARLCTLPYMGLRDKTVQVMHNAFSKPHLTHVRAALCVSESVLSHVRSAYPETLALEIGNFAPLEVYPVKTSRGTIPVIGALGRLHDQKGFDILLEAASQLRDAGVAFHLRIAGDGPEAVSLANQVRQLNLHSQVTFCGWQAPAARFLKELDLFVVPSRYEPFGLVVIEAMAAGVPVLTADLEGPRQILAQGRFGRLFEPQNPAALAEALRQALDEPGALQRTADVAQEHAIDTYGFAAGRARLVQALQTII